MRKKKKAFFILIAAAVVFLLVLPSRQNNQPSYSSPSPEPQLTEEERYILNPPPRNASGSAMKKHKETVAKLAQDASSLEINNCKPSPLVIKTQVGSEIRIINKDSVERKIIFDSKNIFNIPSESEIVIKTQFKYGAGDYGYVCEGSGIVGFMHVIK